MSGIKTIPSWVGSWGIRFSILAWYLWQMNPYCGFYDAIAFLWSAERGFDLSTNATSHFLYNNIQHLLVLALPLIPSVTVLGLFNVVCSWLALMLFHRSVLRFHPPWKAHIAMGALALSFTWWQQTETIEVYGLSNLLLMLYALPALEWEQNQYKPYPGVRVHFWLGIALITHIQHILAVPMLAWQAWGLYRKGRIREILPVSISSCFLAGFCLIAWAMPDQSVMAVFTDRQFGDEVFASSLQTILTGMAKGGLLLMYNIHVWLPFAGMAVWGHFRNQRLVSPALLAGTFFVFAMRYDVADSHVFYLPSYMVLMWVLPYGLPDFPVLRRYGILVPWISVLLYYCVWQGALMTKEGKAMEQQKAYKGGLAYLVWPGKRNAPDPFALADSLQRHPDVLKGHEWEDGYALASAYLGWKRGRDQKNMH